MLRKPRSQTNRFGLSRSRNCPITYMPRISWLSMNSRSKRSIRKSRFSGCSVYCLSSTIGQQVWSRFADVPSLELVESVISIVPRFSVDSERVYRAFALSRKDRSIIVRPQAEEEKTGQTHNAIQSECEHMY